MNIDAMRNFIRETYWMARRYADGRSTYAPAMFNEALFALKRAGHGDLVEAIGNEPEYARDGMFGEWDPNSRCFRGAPPDGKDMAHHALNHRYELEKQRLTKWVNKKTGKVYHVLSEAVEATNGDLEGRKVVIYFDEMRTYVRDKAEFEEKFEIMEQ